MDEAQVVIVNLSGHPVTPPQRAQVAALTGLAVDRVIDVPVHIDQARPLVDQAVAVVDQVGLSPTDWQSLPLVVNPPGLAPLASVLLAELHGRLGYFPTLMRVRPVPGAVPPRYEVAELLNLQVVRDAVGGGAPDTAPLT